MHGGGSWNAWGEQWLPHSMHGARSGHEVYDVSYELAFLIEQHQRKGEPFGVISMDRRNFFDLLDWDIANNLILASRCDPKVVNAESRFTHNWSIYSRFRMGQAISNLSSRINGYIQGDSWSVQVALAVIAVWSKTMMEAHVHTSGFLDDSNFRANNLELQDGEISNQPAKHLMQLSTEFASIQRKLRLTIIPSRTLRWSGSQASARRSAAAKYIGAKVSKAIATCHSIGRLPLHGDARLRILGSKNLSRVSFGFELLAPTPDMLKSLTSARNMFALFGHVKLAPQWFS